MTKHSIIANTIIHLLWSVTKALLNHVLESRIKAPFGLAYFWDYANNLCNFYVLL
jgi:hypothetical protein